MSSSPTRRSTRRSRLTEKGLANLNQAKTATDSRSPADSPMANETTKKPTTKGKAKGEDAKVTKPKKAKAKVTKPRKVGYKKSRLICQKKKKRDDDTEDEDYNDDKILSDPSNLDNLLELMEDDDVEEEEQEEVSEEGGDRFVNINFV